MCLDENISPHYTAFMFGFSINQCCFAAPLTCRHGPRNESRAAQKHDVGSACSSSQAPCETRVVVHQTALGDRETELPLTYQPRMLAGSTLFPERFLPKDIDKLDLVCAMYSDGVTLGSIPFFPARLMCALLRVPVLRFPAFFAFLPWIILHQIQQRMSGCKQLAFKTPVRSLSTVLKEQGLHGKTIDFLKVDVEGAELQVLTGIDDVTWQRINQLVVEVHDGDDGRVRKIMELCTTKGFSHVVQTQEKR